MALSAFDPKAQPEAYNVALDLSQMWPKEGPRNLLLLGPRGVGKTHLAAGLLLELATRDTVGTFVDWTQLVAELKMSDDQRAVERARLEPLLTRVVICLDDVSRSSTMTEHLVGWRDNIINSRWVRGLPTIWTANLSVDEFKSDLGGAGASRVFESVLAPKFRPGDRRLNALPGR
jgi:DNA replication protein DnaC